MHKTLENHCQVSLDQMTHVGNLILVAREWTERGGGGDKAFGPLRGSPTEAEPPGEGGPAGAALP